MLNKWNMFNFEFTINKLSVYLFLIVPSTNNSNSIEIGIVTNGIFNG